MLCLKCFSIYPYEENSHRAIELGAISNFVTTISSARVTNPAITSMLLTVSHVKQARTVSTHCIMGINQLINSVMALGHGEPVSISLHWEACEYRRPFLAIFTRLLHMTNIWFYQSRSYYKTLRRFFRSFPTNGSIKVQKRQFCLSVIMMKVSSSVESECASYYYGVSEEDDIPKHRNIQNNQRRLNLYEWSQGMTFVVLLS